MPVTKGTWCMHKRCVPGSLSSSPAQEPENVASIFQVNKGTWRMHKRCVPGSLSSSPAQEPENVASIFHNYTWQTFRHSISRPFLSMQRVHV